MARKKVVHIDGDPNADWTLEREILAGVDADLVVGGAKTDEEVLAVAGDADAIMTTMYFMNRAMFEQLPNCQVVVRGGVCYDNLDVDAATDNGILICNIIDYGYHEVANHAFALLLAMNRKLIPLDKGARAGQPRPERGALAHVGRINGQTLGLVAFGHIAQEVAKRGQGFGMRVIAFDPYIDPSVASAAGVELVELDELMRQSDWLSVHAPLSAATRGLIGAEQLALVKPNLYLAITSRGGVVDEEALADALREQRLAGAGIDVWVHEPVRADEPLLAFDNVIATNHYAWYGDVSAAVLRQRIPEAVADVLRGVKPRSIVNPSVLATRPLADRVPD
jgi:D-3-phosphoglycerate dehydrogenase